MIGRKELNNRIYHGKECIRFDCSVVDKTSEAGGCEECFKATFNRAIKDSKLWSMIIVIPRDRDRDSQVYCFEYMLPKDGMPLELVAAIGLKYFQLKLKEEIQQKSNWDFVLGDLLKDM